MLVLPFIQFISPFNLNYLGIAQAYKGRAYISTKMVSFILNVITFLVLMVLLLLHVTQWTASITDMNEVLASGHHETSKLAVVPRTGTLNLNRNQEIYEVSNMRLLGRKMVFERLLGMAKAEVVYLNGEQSSGSITPTATPSASALSVRGSINNSNAQPKRLSKISRGRSPHTHRRVKVKIAGNFIPLNADYHVPRPHPPKNN